MADILKFMHCGCEYTFCSSDSSSVTADILGNGCDGDCVIEYDESVMGNTFMEAKEYNFCNFTVCEGVKLRFCGQGIPIIRVKGNFLNEGTICLRNPFIQCNIEYSEPHLNKIFCGDCNANYSQALSLLNALSCECLMNTAARGGLCVTACCNYVYSGEGFSGGTINTVAQPTTPQAGRGSAVSGVGGASTEYAAGGGGGGWANYTYCGAYVNGNNGCDAVGYIGGKGGDGGCCSSAAGGGGGGGFGLCGGGDGGSGSNNSNFSNGGDGGNSIYGNGGNGGMGDYYQTGRCRGEGPGWGGCSYYGNGGNGGPSSHSSFPGNAGRGGCSVFGNGGSGGTYGQDCGNKGGSSVYGDGGVGLGTCGMHGCIAWGGIYDIGIFASDICNNGCILGGGSKGGCTNSGTRGAKIYLAYNTYSSNGCIEYCGGGCASGKVIYNRISG